MFHANRRLASEYLLSSTVLGNRECAHANDQQLLITEFDRQRGTDDRSIASGISVADRFDYRMFGHCEWHLVPYELDYEHNGSTRRPNWQPDRPGHQQETGGLPTESRSASETGEQINQTALYLQKQQRYVVHLANIFFFSLFFFSFDYLLNSSCKQFFSIPHIKM